MSADFCVECGVSFFLVDRYRDLDTCTHCAAKLRPSEFGQCDECRRIIEKGQKIHLGWVKLCRPCVRRINRHDGMNYRTETVAF